MGYEIQQTRWDRIIRRVSGSIGPGSRVSETISDLFPMVDVERVPGELLLLGGTQICMGRAFVSPLAANFAQVMLRNPLDSGALITLTQVVMFSATAQSVTTGMTQTLYTVPGAKAIRDGRAFAPSSPIGDILGDSLPVTGSDFFRQHLDGLNAVVLRDDNGLAVLSPGTAYSISTRIVNTDLETGWMWRERPAEQSELNL